MKMLVVYLRIWVSAEVVVQAGRSFALEAVMKSKVIQGLIQCPSRDSRNKEHFIKFNMMLISSGNIELH